jgi:hypothetical protein
VGLGDYVGMPNATIITRLAREDGVLLRPDRPLAPMDVLVAGLVGQRGLPDGARLWMTHATVGVEDPECPELTQQPTRRLVSHTGVDATRISTVPEGVKAQPVVLLQWIVMAVDVPGAFPVLAADLYPRPSQLASGLGTILLVRDWHGPPCKDGDTLSPSSCLAEINATTALFDARTDTPEAVTCERCKHRFRQWLVYPSSGAPGELVLLGDLTKAVPLSGYRFRLSPTSSASAGLPIVLIGNPGEAVPITYVLRDAKGAATIRVQSVTIGDGGRVTLSLP